VGFATVIIWFATVLMGLFMLAVWLIENDVTGQGVAPSRLPKVIVFVHLLLAATGLVVWVAYLVFSRKALAWTAVGILVAIALLGATMFARWIPVYAGPARTASQARDARTASPALDAGSAFLPAQPADSALAANGPLAAPAQVYDADLAVPAEGNFPVVVVAAHGLLAVSTLVLAVLTAIG
jgi:hypothetical protein